MNSWAEFLLYNRFVGSPNTVKETVIAVEVVKEIEA